MENAIILAFIRESLYTNCGGMKLPELIGEYVKTISIEEHESIKENLDEIFLKIISETEDIKVLEYIQKAGNWKKYFVYTV